MRYAYEGNERRWGDKSGGSQVERDDEGWINVVAEQLQKSGQLQDIVELVLTGLNYVPDVATEVGTSVQFLGFLLLLLGGCHVLH